jgi:phosphatidylserine decarboxylase
MKEASIKQVIVVADHQFGVLQLAREGKATRLYGVTTGPGIETALGVLREAGVSVTLAVPDALLSESVTLLNRLLPAVNAIITGTEAISALEGPERARLIVAADRVVRGRAVRAGADASPHLAIASLELCGRAPRFVRAVGLRESFERLRELIPYYIEPAVDGRIVVLGVISREALDRAKSLAIQVEELALDLAVEDPMLVRLDESRQLGRPANCRILRAEEQRVLVALPPDTMNDEIGVHGEHGHLLFLSPSPLLLKPAPRPGSGLRQAQLAMTGWPEFMLKPDRMMINPDILRWILSLFPVTATQYQSDVDRYCGRTNLDAAGPIVSRHIAHPDNGRVVQALLSDLNAIGYCAYTQSFSHGGQILHNVIADLPGNGLLRIRPDILERIRELLIRYPWPDPPDPWLAVQRRLGGEKWLRDLRPAAKGPLSLRKMALRLPGFEHGCPWWAPLCKLPGPGAEIVVMGCHLDSTAPFSTGGYNPATDPAPGADDNASGIAATLAIARYLWGFRNTLPHTVRFCFFNAEEQGMVGSRAYVQHLKTANAPVRAGICVDMIGYNSDANCIFEIHSGYTDAAIRDASTPIADTIASWAATLGGLAPAQIYSGTNNGSGTDRTLYDAAIGRSDHASFHDQGYPAVVVSEDFFVNTAAEPLADPNPNYHDEDDLTVDATYAADITCAIAHAV